MKAATDKMPSSRERQPFEFYHFVDSLGVVYIKLAVFFAHFGQTDTIVYKSCLTIYCINIESNLWEQIESIIDFVHLGSVCCLKQVLQLCGIHQNRTHLGSSIHHTLRSFDILVLRLWEYGLILISQIEK